MILLSEVILTKNTISKSSSKRSRCFHKFLSENNFITKVTEPTFIHPNGKDSSTIDYFLHSPQMQAKVENIIRKDDYMANVSDHYPVEMTLLTNLC